MHFQASLPRLPIPKLEDSCKKYLRAQQPILSDEEWKETSKKMQEFLSSDGPQLQKKLVDHDSRNKHTSYVSEPWFHMYLKDRKPVPINYNPMLVYDQEIDPRYNDQLVRATNLVVSSARFMKSLRDRVLEPELYHMNPKKSDTEFFRNFTRILPPSISWYGAYLLKVFPLDMSQYPNLFGTARIPEIGKDRLLNNPKPRHIVVMRKGHFYSVDILNENEKVRPAREIATSLKAVLSDERSANACPIGSLTTLDRDEWAKNRRELSTLGNKKIFDKIDSAAFVLILDDEIVNDDYHRILRTYLHADGTNRWFDKSFSLIVTKDGVAGINFEHSWGDGVAVLRYFQDIKKDVEKKARLHPDEIATLPVDSSTITKLDFTVDSAMKKTVDEAIDRYKKWTDRLCVDYLIYDGFGKKECKEIGVSPDAVMQVAFQLALYKLEARSVATYESCSTSAFKHGRTETVRSCTNETKALCLAIIEQEKSGVSMDHLKKLMLACSEAHGNLVKEAAMGQGFDRHLFALKDLWDKSNSSGGSLPAIFKDPAYAKLNHNILSTSTLSSPQVRAGGFGPVVEDGYGIGYVIQNHRLGSVVTSYKPHRHAEEYVKSLSSAVKDLHAILKS
ncbi:carnitine O-palmitoyltransferase 2, mitochondrial isoform X2 [Venturia canescens]|nr:carnitine O-palmitoyltransferase 2, mitochondrial isoform X2 [Venturia canescens]